MFYEKQGWKLPLAGGRSLEFDRTLVMGILNITPDSFYPASRISKGDAAFARAREMIEAGADILDIGAESTRPGSKAATLTVELESVIPLIKTIRREFPGIPLSIDTRKADVAMMAIEAGADIVNDVSGLELPQESERMLGFLGSAKVPYVLTHTQGTPDVMQINPVYDDLLTELLRFFRDKLSLLERSGVVRNRIILDPGIGFGKRYEDNLTILANLGRLRELNQPILIGASRKSFLGKTIGVGGSRPEECLEATLAVSALCAAEHVDIVRVHDVRENKRAVTMTNTIGRYRK